jgi:hypothetical protein
LISVRGDFETSLYSSLSRAQRLFGGPATFGFEVSADRKVYDPDASPTEGKEELEGSNFRLGPLIERGCFNYRWPLHEYHLLRNEMDAPDESQPKHDTIVGTCVMFSFVKDRVLYQIIRIEEGSDQDSDSHSKLPEPNQIVLTIGGPARFQSFAFSDRLEGQPINRHEKADTRKVASDTCLLYLDRTREIGQQARTCLRYLDTARAIGMEARVYQHCPSPNCTECPGFRRVGEYKQLGVQKSRLEVDSGAESGETYPWDVPAYNAFGRLVNHRHEGRCNTTFLAAIRLREAPELRKQFETRSEDWLKEYLSRGDWAKEFWPEEEKWPELPTSKDIYDYIGVDPRSPDAVGAMWETIFLDRERKTDSSSELAEVRLIGRSLEKILQVDLVPDLRCPAPILVPVSNIFHWPLANIDLKALL